MQIRSAERWDFISLVPRSAAWWGRIGASVVADWLGWRVALACIGAACLVGAFVFRWAAPLSRSFVPRSHDRASLLTSIRILRNDAALPVALYRSLPADGRVHHDLQLRQLSLAGPAVFTEPVGGRRHFFCFYIVGLVCLDLVWPSGRAAGAPAGLFWIPILTFLAGVVLTAAAPLIVIVIGIGVATAGYFGAHSVASSWVSRRGHAAPAQAAAFYLFFLYVGSSILGYAGGVAWSRGGGVGRCRCVYCLSSW